MHLKPLVTYLIAHDKRQALPPLVLSFVGIGLLMFTHATYPIPAQGMLAMAGLWGLFQTLVISQLIVEDFNDGTTDWIMIETGGLWRYMTARLFAIMACFSLPLLVCYGVLLGAGISVASVIALSLVHLQAVLGVFSVQFTLCMARQSEAKFTALFLFLPFWLPSFLYLVGMQDVLETLFLLSGLLVFQAGATLCTVHATTKWRSLA